MKTYCIPTVLLAWLLTASSLAFSETAVPSYLLTEQTILPDMASIQDVNQKKQTFFDFLQPIVAQINEKVQAERAWLKVVEAKIRRGDKLGRWQTNFMSDLADYYKVDEALGSKPFFSAMFHRVDTLPTSLVLAQAANESAWGTSRFAVEGNNLFGQWCFSEGCGLVPSERDNSALHEVKKFDSIQASVAGYFRNLNTHQEYQPLRQIRSELRYLQLPIDSTFIVWGLEGYSIRGEPYIRELISMIDHNGLQSFDRPAFYAKNDVQVNFD